MTQREIFTPIEILSQGSLNPVMSFEITRKVVTPFTKSIISYAISETGQQVVIKVPVKEGKAEREWVGLTKAHLARLPVPEPIALVKTQADQFALVTERIYGKNLYNHPDNQASFLLGQTVRKMHEQVIVGGKEWYGGGTADYTYYDKLLRSWRQGQIGYVDAKSKAQSLFSLLSHSMGTHCKSITPAFNHNDIHDGQVIVGSGKIALIDFEEWIENSHLNDIAYYLFHSIRTERTQDQFWHFLKGYLDKKVFSEIEKSSLMFYLLFISSRALSYFYYRKDEYLETAITTHQKITDYVESEKFWKEF